MIKLIYMKYLKIFILFIGFICLSIYLDKNGDEEFERKNKVLNNNINFTGYVIKINESRNHAFGIINLKLTQSNVNKFNNELPNGIYPYRIQGNIAEIYTVIPDGLNNGDIVSLKSLEQNAHFYNIKTKEKSEGLIWVVTNSTDIEFIKENTIFK